MDGEKSLNAKQRWKLTLKLSLDGKSRPTRRVWIPKPGRKELRPLGIPTMEDRVKQTLLRFAMEPEWEARFETNSYGFRPGRSCHDAVQAIFNGIRYIPKFVLDADIAKCFDRINHKALLSKLNISPKFSRQIKAWLKSGVIDFSKWAERKGYQETSEGTPQGGAISPLLANIALHGLENLILKSYPVTQKGYLQNSNKLYGKMVRQPILIRYADDFVILHEELSVIQKCRTIVEEWLSNISLELKIAKRK